MNGHLIPNQTTIYDHTDGCSCQYRSGNALLQMSILSYIFKVAIDCFIHCPAHGKGVVDGRNTVNKNILLNARVDQPTLAQKN